jgi:hypothetical protein
MPLPHDPLAFFEDAYRAFEVATQAAGVEERWCQLAGETVCLRFAGAALLPYLIPALEHLAVSPREREADLTVGLWDSASTGTTMTARPWAWEQNSGRGDVQGYNDGRIHTALSVDAGALSLMDRDRNAALYWIRDAHQLPIYERAEPLKAILHWHLRQSGMYMIHTAAVATDEGCALLVGKTGAGKSSTALTCAAAGMGYVGDDHCLLTVDTPPRAYCVYNSAKMEGARLRLLPGLAQKVRNPGELHRNKALLFLHNHEGLRLQQMAPVQVVLLAEVTKGSATRLGDLSAAEVLRHLAPSSMVYLPNSSHAEFRAMAALVRQVPCYRLELGSNIAGIAPLVKEAICRAGR